MTTFKPMHTAPKDRPLLLLTGDFGVVEGRWREDVPNFYRSQPHFVAAYDPNNMMGDWCSHWSIGDEDEHGRLTCGALPIGWADIPVQVEADYCGTCKHKDADESSDDGWGWCDDCGPDEQFRYHAAEGA